MPAGEHHQQQKPTPSLPRPPVYSQPNTDIAEGDLYRPDIVRGAGPRNDEHPLDTTCDHTGELDNTATAASASALMPCAGVSARTSHEKEKAPAEIPDRSEANRPPSLPAQPEKQPSSVAAQAQQSATAVNTGSEPVLRMPAAMSGDEIQTDGTPNFFDWKEVFPELKALVQGLPEILAECTKVSNWKAWPEKHYEEGGEQDWKVFPFVHTFPAYDESRRTWIDSTCSHCPATTKLLRGVPNLRTALFSRLGAGSRIAGHRGWADLANYVLRCHLPLNVPVDGQCGLWVNGEVVYHAEGEIVVFDDSKLHRAFNNSTGDRLVLIVDILRPANIALGTADGGHTPELDSFINAFR